MAGPTRIYQYFTDAELVVVLAQLKQETTTGSIVAVSGAGKASSMQIIPLADRWKAYNLEQSIRGGTPRPQKVVQILNPDFCNSNGATQPGICY